jgi:hypothetical protein
MLRHKILPAILVVLSASAALTTQPTIVEATPDACRTGPGSATPPGSRWYYHVNRINNHRCWYLSSQRVEVRSRVRGALFVRRHLAHRSASVLLKRLAQDRQLDPRTATAHMTPDEAALPVEQATLLDFAARWHPTNSQDLDADKVATTNYADTYPATNAQMPLMPIVDTKQAGQQQTSAGEAAYGQAFLGGALAAALLAAGGGFYLARRPHRPRPHDQWCADRPDQRWHKVARSAEPARNRLAARTRHDASVRSAPTPTDPVDDVKTSLRELTGDLQRAGLARVSPQSFAPRTRTFEVAASS